MQKFTQKNTGKQHHGRAGNEWSMFQGFCCQNCPLGDRARGWIQIIIGADSSSADRDNHSTPDKNITAV